MNRNKAYFSVLKFHFQAYIVHGGADLKTAYRMAKELAAETVFSASSESLKIWVPVR